MTALIQLMLPAVEVWSELRWYGRLGELAWLIVPAILCYVILLWIMGFRPKHIVA